MTLKLGMQHRMLEYYQVCSNDDPGLTMTYCTARSNLVPYVFVWEMGKTMDFSETIVVNDLKLATDDQSDQKFLSTSKLCPLGTVCPLPRGYIHVSNHDQSDQKFLLTSKLCPLGTVCPLPCGYIHVLNHEKIVLSQTSKRFF